MSNAAPINMTAAQSDAMLFTLACQSSMQQKLAAVKESVIYAVTGEWQKKFFADAQNVSRPLSALAFEAAVQDAQQGTIYVPAHAGLTLEIARRILQRNPQMKTVFWES